MFKVKMQKVNFVQTFGTYTTLEHAEAVVAEHAASGYWARIWIEEC